MSEESVQVPSEQIEVRIAKDFIPTPYRQSQWEGIENVDKNPTFNKISVEVIANPNQTFDPMFEQFDRREKEKLNSSDELIETEEQPVVIPEEVLEEVRRIAFEEGLEKGKQNALAESQLEIVEKYEALAESMKNISNDIKNELTKKIEELEQKSVELALDVSKKILHTTVDARPDYILDVIRNGLANLGSSKPLRVRVSSSDYEFLEVVGLPEDLTMEGAKIQYLPDENITSGCIVETDYGELNLEIDKMWNEIKDNLFKAIS